MSSRRSRGRAFELWARDWLEEQGWAVHVCGRKTMMVSPRKFITRGDDIFGCDLICLRADEKPLFIQATLDTNVQKRIDEIKKYPWNLRYCQVQLWQKTKSGEVNVKAFTDEKFVDIGKIIRRKFYVKKDTDE